MAKTFHYKKVANLFNDITQNTQTVNNLSENETQNTENLHSKLNWWNKTFNVWNYTFIRLDQIITVIILHVLWSKTYVIAC